MPIAFQPHRQCKACSLIFDEAGDRPPSTSTLYKKFQRVNKGGLPLRQVQRDLREAGTPISYDALRNHVAKHQDVSNAPARTPQAKVARVEREIIEDIDRKNMHHSERRTAVLEKLQELLDQGQLKGATFTAMATLLKQEADIEEKAKDRTLEMQKLFASYVANPLAKEAIEGSVVEQPHITSGDL